MLLWAPDLKVGPLRVLIWDVVFWPWRCPTAARGCWLMTWGVSRFLHKVAGLSTHNWI